MDSILDSVKHKLNVPLSDTYFDDDIIMDINTVFNILSQLGAGPTAGFHIESNEEEWTDYISDITKLEMVKSYVYAKVRFMFDPPQSSSAMDALSKCIAELESRISYAVD